jgi:CDGSH-type Zn-finger protein
MNKLDDNNIKTIVEVIDGGPLKIKGKIYLKDLKKDILDYPDEVYLCRCSHSCKKPYCDGSHKSGKY